MTQFLAEGSVNVSSLVSLPPFLRSPLPFLPRFSAHLRSTLFPVYNSKGRCSRGHFSVSLSLVRSRIRTLSTSTIPSRLLLSISRMLLDAVQIYRCLSIYADDINRFVKSVWNMMECFKLPSCLHRWCFFTTGIDCHNRTNHHLSWSHCW